jgi:hypothetical protein
MKAEEFYRDFEAGFVADSRSFGRKKLAGRTLKFKVETPVGGLAFHFATNSRAAGLLQHHLWPGEFRLLVSWQTGRGQTKRVAGVSIFQYTTEVENGTYAALQRRALRKYLEAGGSDPSGTLTEEANDLGRKPRANFEEWCYYADSADAREWGLWYGNVFGPFIERFVENPESLEDWCWRVLWPHLERKVRT